MSRYDIREEPIDSVGVQEVLARQDEETPARNCRGNIFQMARRALKRLDRTAYSRSE